MSLMNYTDHFSQKIQNFKDYWSKHLSVDLPEMTLHPSHRLDTRCKADFVTEHNAETNSHVIGFYAPQTKTLEDVQEHPLFSKELQDIYIKFRKVAPKVRKGSVRIRVSPENKKGLWLDFANTDIRDLLNEKTQLQKLLEIFDVIEIGQKRKQLDPITLKLVDPISQKWFETYIQGDAIPLFCQIASFSQTGFAPNNALIQEIEKLIEPLKIKTWFEACSGSGNFTIPLAYSANNVIATELDAAAIENIEQTLQNLSPQYSKIPSKIEFHRMNIHRASEELLQLVERCDGIFVDPPRSGLQDFVSVVSQLPKKPKYFLYVSCFYQSMIEDLQKLAELGYKLTQVSAIDQFPFSEQCEWIALLEL